MSEPYQIIVRQNGGPDVMTVEPLDVPEPGIGEIVFRTEAIGLNFIDTYYRAGLYPAALPLVPGSESVGTIVAIGKGVSGWRTGDRVGAVNGPDAYATHRRIAADQAIRLPDTVDFDVAAAAMLKGFTACYLAEMTYAAQAGETALVHSAAGGVGSFLVPWLRDKGVQVIAHVGSAAKAAKVEADHVLWCPFENLASAVRGIAPEGCHVVYDGVGQASWAASLACLRRHGAMVSYGNASGAVPPVSLLDLMRAGSISVTRPTLADYISTPEELRQLAEHLFRRIAAGVLRPEIGQVYELKHAPDAHRALEARATTGSTILKP